MVDQSKSDGGTSGTGHLRPDRTLTNVFSGVVRDMLDEEHGAVKAGANKALLDFLESAPDEIVDYNLKRAGFESIEDLRSEVRSRQSVPFPNEGEQSD